MKFLTLTLAFISLQLFSAEGGSCGHFLSGDGLEEGKCEEFKADHTDKASMQRGAKNVHELLLWMSFTQIC